MRFKVESRFEETGKLLGIGKEKGNHRSERDPSPALYKARTAAQVKINTEPLQKRCERAESASKGIGQTYTMKSGHAPDYFPGGREVGGAKEHPCDANSRECDCCCNQLPGSRGGREANAG